MLSRSFSKEYKMKKLLLITFSLFLLDPFFSVSGAEPKYPVSAIPKELLENAKAVIRISEMSFEINSVAHATLKNHYAITILNENAIDDSYLVQFYDKFSRVSGLSATVYDKNGKKVRKIPAGEIIDHSAVSGFSLYEDNRVKFIDPKYRTVPFTIEYSYTIDYNGLLSYPGWFPNHDFDVSVEETSFDIMVPNGITFRYYEQNLPCKVSITNTGSGQIYSWKASHLKVLRREPLCPPFSQYAPQLFTAPDNFKIAGFEGNATTWENFGKWIGELNQNRNILPEETRLQLTGMVEKAETETGR